MEFRLVREGGYPLLAFPAGPRAARLNSIDRINGYTAKRWGLKQTLRAAAAFGAHTLFSGPSEDPLQEYAGIPSDSVLDMLQDALGKRPTALSVLWPWPVRTTRSRVYVHAFDADGHPVAFVKIALTSAESNRLGNEIDMLQALADTLRSGVRVPRLIANGTLGAAAFIAVEPLPLHLHPLEARAPFPEAVALQIAGARRTLTATDVEEQSWWPQVEVVFKHHPFVRNLALAALRQYGLRVQRVHGDFSQKNILRDRDHLWVIDWETGAQAGPCLVDELAFLLQGRSRQIKTNPLTVLTELKTIAARDATGSASAVAVALAYLSAVSLPEADTLLTLWNERKGLAL